MKRRISSFAFVAALVLGAGGYTFASHTPQFQADPVPLCAPEDTTCTLGGGKPPRN